MLKFVLFEANWALVAINRKLFFIGSYPADEMFRVWISLFIAAALISLTYGIWGGRLRPYVAAIGVAATIVLTFGLGTDLRIEERQFTAEIQSARADVRGKRRGEDACIGPGVGAIMAVRGIPGACGCRSGTSWLLLAALLAVLIGGAWVGRRAGAVAEQPGAAPSDGRRVGAAHPHDRAAPVGGIEQQLGERIPGHTGISRWGGSSRLLSGCCWRWGACQPTRPSGFPRWGTSKVVRAAPLLVWLLFATFLRDELGPAGEAFSSIGLVYRVMIVFAFFGGAYIAEVVRGGLQSIPRGQHEASEAMGLSATQKYAFIILPQAIRAVIPAIIGRFIALWKDTALLAAISLVNTLEKAKKISRGPDGT